MRTLIAYYKNGMLSLKHPQSVAKRSTATEIRVQAN